MSDPIETKILQILNSYYPELDASPGSPFYEYVVRPAAFLWSKHQEGAEEFIAGNTLNNYASMTEEDLDHILANYFEERKQGSYVYATLRIFFSTRQDIVLSKGVLIEAINGKTYETLGTSIAAADLTYSEGEGYYGDFGIVSTEMGGDYNLYAYQTVDPTKIYDPIASLVAKAYCVSNSTDGGTVETNIQFYTRVREAQSLKNLTTYRGVRATLTGLFNIRRVTVAGLRDDEMRRDVLDLPGVGPIHRGGCADFYVSLDNLAVLQGYAKPLGFPMSYKGYQLALSPVDLATAWNSFVAVSLPDVDPFTRGSALEAMPGLTDTTDMQSLTANLEPIHEFVTNTDYEAIHTDNLVRQAWPLVVTIKASIKASNDTTVQAVKDALIAYINYLPGDTFPNEANLSHIMLGAGATEVHTPLAVTCYYLNEQARIESIGFELARDPADALLVPQERDSLRYKLSVKSQISPRTARWYTQDNLITLTRV